MMFLLDLLDADISYTVHSAISTHTNNYRKKQIVNCNFW